ncbi:hypothetical protein [Angustibacter aerolatus]
MLARRSRARRVLAAVTGATVAGLALLAAPGAAQAKETASNAHFAVTLNGRTYDAAAGEVRLKGVTPSGRITVRGANVGFTVDPATLGVYDYALTGAPVTGRMVTTPTTIFASKVPQLTAAQTARPVVQELRVRDADLVLVLATAAGSVKVQAKDAPQGGIFQVEPEGFGGSVTMTHTLGAGLFYFVNSFTGKVNFGDGTDAVSRTASATGWHDMLLGKDSPQVATKTYQDGTSTRWLVTSGGRMGGVLGEDAIELSAGATSCTSRCQAQNRIRGSLPVPPNPTDPTPIGG